MTVSKAVVRGIWLASLAVSSAQGGSILYLGVSSGDSSPGPSTSPLPLVALPPLGPVPSNPAGSSLSLPLQADSAPAVPVPPTAPAPLSPTSMPVEPPPPVYVAPPPSASGKYDAFINLGAGPFADSASLTTGRPQPWYVGTSVDRFFGGIPTIQQAATFDQTILQRVQQTFALGGIPLSLTADPNVPAAHSISVVSQTSNPSVGNALGMTYLGGNGFQYIDVAAQSASSIDQLEWIVAHNVAHELMLAFNVPEVNDQSGRYIDSPTASWSMITSPTATFSPGAVADLLSRNFQADANGSVGGGAVLNPSPQVLGLPTVPEPTTVILWLALVSAGLMVVRSTRLAGPVSLP